MAEGSKYAGKANTRYRESGPSLWIETNLEDGVTANTRHCGTLSLEKDDLVSLYTFLYIRAYHVLYA